MRAEGFEPPTHGLKGRCKGCETPYNPGVSGGSPDCLGALLGVSEADYPELVEVVKAWPGLPEALKAGIVAMVNASKGK